MFILNIRILTNYSIIIVKYYCDWLLLDRGILVADAIDKGADTLITCGGIQSNHCRLTLAAAVKEKMKCILVLEEGLTNSEPDFNGNYFLYHLLGAEKVKIVPNGTDLMEEMQKVAKEVTDEGNKPYIIPVVGIKCHWRNGICCLRSRDFGTVL